MTPIALIIVGYWGGVALGLWVGRTGQGAGFVVGSAIGTAGMVVADMVLR